MPYILNSGSLALRGDIKGKNGKPDRIGRGPLEVYTAWENNVIEELSEKQVAKLTAGLTPRVTFVAGELSVPKTALDPAVPVKVSRMAGAAAVAFIATMDNVEALHQIAAVDTRVATSAAVAKRVKELDD